MGTGPVHVERRGTRDFTPFLLLEAATLLSGAGNGAAIVVLPWLVLERTGSATSAGILAGATALPLLISSLFSGTIVDRVGRRRTAITSDVLSGIAVAAIPIVDYTIGLNLGWLVVLAVVGAAFDPSGVTARETMLPAVAERAGWSLDRVNGVHEGVWEIAYLVGPGVGGVLIAWIGAVNALWVTAVGFVLSALSIWLMRVDVTSTSAVDTAEYGIFAGTGEGMRFLWRDPLLRGLLVISAVLVATYMPVEGVLLPVYFEELDEAGRLGGIVMAMSAGGLIGALGYGLFASRVRRSLTFRLSYLVTAVFLFVLALLPGTGLMALAAFLIGVAYGPVGPILNLAMQTRSPEHMRGRVIGLMSSTEYAAGPFGFFIVGAATQRFGVAPVFLAIASIIVVVALATLAMRSLDDLDSLGDGFEPPTGTIEAVLEEALDAATRTPLPGILPPREP